MVYLFDVHLSPAMTTKGHRRFLAIMVAIFGGFKVEFRSSGNFPLPRARNAYQLFSQ
jgi:hypothetical protein